jgi:hypothetical protein
VLQAALLATWFRLVFSLAYSLTLKTKTKHWLTFNGLHGATSLKLELFLVFLDGHIPFSN